MTSYCSECRQTRLQVQDPAGEVCRSGTTDPVTTNIILTMVHSERKENRDQTNLSPNRGSVQGANARTTEPPRFPRPLTISLSVLLAPDVLVTYLYKKYSIY